jgi:hypothetical protein
MLEPRRLLSGVSDTNSTATDLLTDGATTEAGSPQPGPNQPDGSPAALASVLPSPVPTSVLSTSPSNGQEVSGSLGTLVITFDQDVDHTFLWSGSDLMLYRVNADQSLTPMFDPSKPIDATFDATGQVATVSLSPSIGPGHYRLMLEPGLLSAMLSMDPGVTDPWDFMQEQRLADFTVAARGVTLSDAVDLGRAGPRIQNVPGTLDLSNGQNGVALYKVTLGPGHAWRLGLQLDAQAIGSPLLGALSLFDSSGHLIATRNAGTGRPVAVNDPYLFAGLAPGTYYIGVSGEGNLPGQPGGYDPVTGHVATNGLVQSGGAYNLEVVADPVGGPTRVVGSSLDWDDTLGQSPTGFTLEFSGPIDPDSLWSSDPDRPPLVLVDQSGKSWPLFVSGYNESKCEVSFVFEQALPPGRYTLKVPATGGLTDLAGLAPVASGLPSGVLATWSVQPRYVAPSPNNLGVFWPSMTGGITRSITIQPGQTSGYRLVVPAGGLYTLSLTVNQGNLTITRVSSSGSVVLQAPTMGPTTGGRTYVQTMFLDEGIYTFSFKQNGPQTVQGLLTISLLSIDHESLINNGVGQTSAMEMRLATPSGALAATGSPPPGAIGPVVEVIGAPSPLDVGPTTSGQGVLGSTAGPALITLTPSPIPSSLLVTVPGFPIGQPSSQGEQIGVVGPTVPGSAVALADRSPGLQAGLLHESTGSATDLPSTDPVEPTSDGPLVESSVAPGTPAPAPPDASQPEQADALALMKADRLTQLARSVARWFALGSDPIPAAPPSTAEVLAPTLVADAGPVTPIVTGDWGSGAEGIDRAELGIPTGLIVLSALAYRYRRMASNWTRRRRVQSQRGRGLRPQQFSPRPHLFTGFSRPRRKTAAR